MPLVHAALFLESWMQIEGDVPVDRHPERCPASPLLSTSWLTKIEWSNKGVHFTGENEQGNVFQVMVIREGQQVEERVLQPGRKSGDRSLDGAVLLPVPLIIHQPGVEWWRGSWQRCRQTRAREWDQREGERRMERQRMRGPHTGTGSRLISAS